MILRAAIIGQNILNLKFASLLLAPSHPSIAAKYYNAELRTNLESDHSVRMLLSRYIFFNTFLNYLSLQKKIRLLLLSEPPYKQRSAVLGINSN